MSVGGRLITFLEEFSACDPGQPPQPDLLMGKKSLQSESRLHFKAVAEWSLPLRISGLSWHQRLIPRSQLTLPPSPAAMPSPFHEKNHEHYTLLLTKCSNLPI